MTSPALQETGENSASLAKKAVNIGALSALYFVLVFGLGFLGILGPIFCFIAWAISIIVSGPVIMLLLAKTQSMGTITILGSVVAALMFITGHSWHVLVAGVVLGLAADLIVRAGNYRSSRMNILAYAVMSLWFISPLFPIFGNSEAYFADVARQMGQEYADGMRLLFTPLNLCIWAVCVFILALIGGYLGTKVMKKHFVKAGII